jgi:hypothetical protein
MTKDEALNLALEALEWSYGGEPMPTKELEAMNAIRQVLNQKGSEMTDDEIKNLADEAGAWAAGLNVESPSVFGLFKRFAKSIESCTLTNQKAKWYQEGVEAEREACARLCDRLYRQETAHAQSYGAGYFYVTAKDCAKKN